MTAPARPVPKAVTSEPKQPLTDRERDVLQRLAGGATYGAIARHYGLSNRTLCWIGQGIMRKFGARNITQAVHLATILGVIGQYPDCGDRAAYLRHLRRDEVPCPACKLANARHGIEQRAGRLGPPQPHQAA